MRPLQLSLGHTTALYRAGLVPVVPGRPLPAGSHSASGSKCLPSSHTPTMPLPHTCLLSIPVSLYGLQMQAACTSVVLR